MHALERDALNGQIAADAARLPTMQRDLALAGSTGGDTTTLHQEQQAIEQRLSANRARHYAPATRTAAAALANERLESGLRSPVYAARISAGGGSAFARRIAGAGTQRARDELARTRAHAVRVAQIPPERRAPIAPPRRRSVAGARRDGLASRPNPTRPATDGQGEPARPARVRSSTITLLRQRQRQGGDPIPADTPRPLRRREGQANEALDNDSVQRIVPRRRQARADDDRPAAPQDDPVDTD
jgi:hypothetical protein